LCNIGVRFTPDARFATIAVSKMGLAARTFIASAETVGRRRTDDDFRKTKLSGSMGSFASNPGQQAAMPRLVPPSLLEDIQTLKKQTAGRLASIAKAKNTLPKR